MPFEIVLDQGTAEVPIADIPGLIAAALHPDVSGAPRTLSYFIKTGKPGAKGVVAQWRGWPVDDAERRVLAELWADLPPLPADATEDQVRPYMEAFREKGANLDWELGVVWNDPGLIAGMLRIQAEGEHRQGIIGDIRAGRLSVIDPISRRPTNEMHPGALVRVEELRRYVAQWDVSLRIADLTVQDLASEIARTAAERHPDQWNKPGRDNRLRGEIAAAMNVHGWPLDGIPGVLQHIRNMVEMGVVGFGLIEVRSRFNGLPPADPDEIEANPANWLISSEHAEAVRKALEVEATRTKPSLDGYVLRQYESEFGENNSANWTPDQWKKVAAEVTVLSETLLTIGDAASLVGHKYGLHVEAIKTLRTQMMAAAGKALTVRHPHTDLPHEPKQVRWYYDLVRADDLDAWFESKKVDYRSQSGPSTPDAPAEAFTESETATGLDRRAILSVEWPLLRGYTQERLGNALSDVPKWLKPARVSVGRAGKRSSTWNPALIAECLAEKGHANKVALGKFLERHFADYRRQWEQGQEL